MRSCKNRVRPEYSFLLDDVKLIAILARRSPVTVLRISAELRENFDS